MSAGSGMEWNEQQELQPAGSRSSCRGERRAEAHDDGDEVRPAPTLRWKEREACDSLALLDADDAPPLPCARAL